MNAKNLAWPKRYYGHRTTAGPWQHYVSRPLSSWNAKVERFRLFFRNRTSSYEAWRDSLIFEVLVETGMGTKDLTLLAIPKRSKIGGWYIQATRSASETVTWFLSSNLAKELCDFVHSGRAKVLSGKRQTKLFLTRRGRPLAMATIYSIFRAARAGTGVDLSRRDLRQMRWEGFCSTAGSRPKGVENSSRA